MKIFNKISPRERYLLLLAIIVVVFYFCFTYVITPELEKSESLTIEQDQVTRELDRAHSLVGREKELEEESLVKLQEIEEKYEVFLKNLNQSQILAKMSSLMNVAKFSIVRYTPTEATVLQVPVESGFYEALKYPLLDAAKQINPKTEEEASQDAGEVIVTEGELEDMLPSYDLSFEFEDATYNSVYEFIQSVERQDKTILMKQLDMEYNGELIRGEIIFSLFGLPPVNEEKMEDYPLVSIIPKGKANPFE